MSLRSLNGMERSVNVDRALLAVGAALSNMRGVGCGVAGTAGFGETTREAVGE